MADLLALADDMRFSKKFEKVSLGQGQGPKAERLLAAGMERGLWVCLQNCHLAVSWLPTLERIVEGIQPDKARSGALVYDLNGQKSGARTQWVAVLGRLCCLAFRAQRSVRNAQRVLSAQHELHSLARPLPRCTRTSGCG